MERLIKKRGLPSPAALAAWLVGCCLMLSLFRFYRSNLCGLLFDMALAPLVYACAGLMLYGGQVWRSWGFRALCCFFAWFFVSIALNEKFFGAFLANRAYLDTLTLYLFVCFPLGVALPPERRRRVIRLLADLSVGVIGALCLLGVVAALRGEYWITRFPTEFGIGVYPSLDNPGAYRRLVVLCYPNAVGMMSAIALLLSAYRMFTGVRLAGKILHGLAMVPLFGALALCVSRTAIIATGVGLGLMAFRYGLVRMTRVKMALRVCLSAAAAGAVLLAVYFGSTLLLDAAPAAETAQLQSGQEGQSASGAALEAGESVTAAERPMSGDLMSFTGRREMWRAALRAMEDTPRLFLIGSSPSAVGTAVEKRMVQAVNRWYQELHNSYLQILFSCGAPCLLFFAVFLALLLVRCCRAFFSTDPDAGELGYLPPLLAAILLIAFLETFLTVYRDVYFANIWFFLIAGCLFSGAGKQKEME